MSGWFPVAVRTWLTRVPVPADVDELAEQVITALAADIGMIRARHGDWVVVLYGRGVPALQLAPHGAVR